MYEEKNNAAAAQIAVRIVWDEMSLNNASQRRAAFDLLSERKQAKLLRTNFLVWKFVLTDWQRTLLRNGFCEGPVADLLLEALELPEKVCLPQGVGALKGNYSAKAWLGNTFGVACQHCDVLVPVEE